MNYEFERGSVDFWQALPVQHTICLYVRVKHMRSVAPSGWCGVHTHRKWNLIFREQSYIIVDFQTLANLLLNDLTTAEIYVRRYMDVIVGQCEC